MSCIFSDVSGHSVKSVSTAEEQVLPRPNSVGGKQGGPATTPQNDKHGEASIPQTEESVDEVLSIPETQSDRLSFPKLQGTAEEDEDEEEEEEDVEEDEEEVEEDDEEDDDDNKEVNGEEGSQDEGDDGDEGEEDERREDAEHGWKRRYRTIHPKKVALSLRRWDLSFLYHVLPPIFTVNAYDVHHEVLFRI